MQKNWIPAFAGMTEQFLEYNFRQFHSEPGFHFFVHFAQDLNYIR